MLAQDAGKCRDKVSRRAACVHVVVHVELRCSRIAPIYLLLRAAVRSVRTTIMRGRHYWLEPGACQALLVVLTPSVSSLERRVLAQFAIDATHDDTAA